MSKYCDNQRISLIGCRTLVIDSVMIQTILLTGPTADYEPYTYYGYHIEDKMGNIEQQDFSVQSDVIDDIVKKQGSF